MGRNPRRTPWGTTEAGRTELSRLAVIRELKRLAVRAGCTLEEAAAHREARERYCLVHGWHRCNRCILCKAERNKRSVVRAGPA